MSRFTKKFLYALFYFGVFSVFGFLIYVLPRFRAERPPSFDFAPSSSSSFLSVLEEQIFRIRDVPSAFLFGKIKNISADYGFRFEYAFLLYGANDELLRQVRGEASARPNSETLLYEVGGGVVSRDVHRVLLQVRLTHEIPAHAFPPSSFVFSEDPRIQILDEERRMGVLGRVRNDGGQLIPEARAVAVLRDSFGFQVFVSGTTLPNLRSFSERSFEIPLPYDADLARQLKSGSAEVYLYPVF